MNSFFSVKYFLNLVLVDEEDRRYFKQQEVIFWRRQPEEKERASESLADLSYRRNNEKNVDFV